MEEIRGVKVVKDNAKKMKEKEPKETSKGTCNGINPLRGYFESFSLQWNGSFVSKIIYQYE